MTNTRTADLRTVDGRMNRDSFAFLTDVVLLLEAGEWMESNTCPHVVSSTDAVGAPERLSPKASRMLLIRH
jgi:hypothetical protein